MKTMYKSLFFVTTLFLGLTAGAMLTEASIIVPFWLRLNPDEFFTWYTKNQASLVDYYTLLEVSSLLLTLLSLVVLQIQKSSGGLWMGISFLFSLFVILTFFIFFKDANAQLNAGPIANEVFIDTIQRWGNWQWIRVGLGSVAFITSLVFLQKEH